MKWLEKTRFSGIVDFLNKKVEKNKEKIQKYEMFGLMIFVAIPLPGTGAWTGALVASVLKMDFKYSMLSIALGSLIADAIMLLVSYGALGLIF